MKLKLVWVVITCITIGVIVFLLFPDVFIPQPPLEELTEARQMLSKAEASQASIYAGDLYSKANLLYDSAMASWRHENGRIFFTKDYTNTKKFAKQSADLAIKAEKLAKSSSKSIWKNYASRMKQLEAKLNLFDKTYANLPMNKSMVKRLAETKLLAHEIDNAVKQKNGLYMAENMSALEKDIAILVDFAENTTEEFFKDFPQWKKWVATAIENSRKNNRKVIIVDKYDRQVHLYDKGNLMHSFKVELGANWMGDKQLSGDKSTPEGIYKVIKRKSTGQTKYHKALLLNYPNEEDKKRFDQNKAKGLIPKNAKIGNLIEIHGDGGKGVDWTDGCVALVNNDMDKVFDLCPENTPVIIVGALKLPSKSL